VEALILAQRTTELVPVLEAFHNALGLPFRSGSVANMSASVPEVMEALEAEVRDRYGAERSRIGDGTSDRARVLRDSWRAAPGPSGPVSGNV
jgi:hypothetical protein